MKKDVRSLYEKTDTIEKNNFIILSLIFLKQNFSALFKGRSRFPLNLFVPLYSSKRIPLNTPIGARLERRFFTGIFAKKLSRIKINTLKK